MFILRKGKEPKRSRDYRPHARRGQHFPDVYSRKDRPVKSGWEIKSGGHIYMFVLPSVAVILFPTDTITSRFSFPPQMKESTWFFCRCRASAHRSGHTRKFNPSVHPPSGAQTFPTAGFPAFLPSDLNEKVNFSLGQTIRCCGGLAIRGGRSTACGHAAANADNLPRLPSASHAKSVTPHKVTSHVMTTPPQPPPGTRTHIYRE